MQNLLQLQQSDDVQQLQQMQQRQQQQPRRGFQRGAEHVEAKQRAAENFMQASTMAPPGQFKQWQAQSDEPRKGLRRTAMLAEASGRGALEAADTMKAQLQALQTEEPTKVFIARRINKLGFQSADALSSYFSSYGVVKGVYVSHSRVKNMRQGGFNKACKEAAGSQVWRLRAAALGFVVMEDPEATARILQDGPEHNVRGAMIKVHPFFRRHGSSSVDMDDYADGGTMFEYGDGEGDVESSVACNGSVVGLADMWRHHAVSDIPGATPLVQERVDTWSD